MQIFNIRKQNEPEANDQIFSLSSGSSFSCRSYPGCVVNGVKFLTRNRDMNRSTQNSGVCVRGPDNQMFYGVLEDIYELSYLNDNSVTLFKCLWFDTRPGKKRIQNYKNRVSVFVKETWYENEPFILASQAEQVFYVDDLFNGPNWKVVEHFRHRHIWDISEPDNDDVMIAQDTESKNIELVVELPEIDSFVLNRDDGASNVVTSDVDAIMKDKSPVGDDFINDEDDESLEEYVEDEVIKSEDDDDINDDVENQQCSSDDE